MGLYDFLIKYNIEYETLINMIYDLGKFIFMNSENTVRWLDDIYDEKEFKKLKGRQNDSKTNYS